MAELIDHVRTLAESIGPRPATSDAEHRAAQWLERLFAERGLETEVQTFEAPRTYAWAYVIYNVLTIASAVAAGYKTYLAWPAFAVSALVAFFMMSDLDTRLGLTRLMPKGPSQNVIARHVPRVRRGEKPRRVVLVAHYDSARASLAFAPSLVKGFPTTLGLMKAATVLTPLFVLACALPATHALQPWLWYAAMAVSAYLVVPLVINVHRELAMPFVAGANDNATGVAALLGVMERIVPAPEAALAGSTGALAGALPLTGAGESEGALTEPGPEAAIPEDFPWVEPESGASSTGAGVLDLDTVEFGAVGDSTGRDVSAHGSAEEAPWAEDAVLPPDVAGEVEAESGERKRRLPLFGRIRRKRAERDALDPAVWLGVDEDFDARSAGKRIGSWDRFDEDEDDFGWKGGWAGEDPIGDPSFAANEAARIRRRVTESVDRELAEKEVWFVATGAEEVGTVGMQAFLREYGDQLREALIINIDGCGAGQLYWVSAEGMARRYRASARLVGLARRVSRETQTLIKPRVYRGLSTDATPALARGFKAISIMALDTAGLPVNWHWHTDTVDAVDPELIATTVELVTAMVREA